MLEFEESTLDRYAIQRRLARGGMSNIYLAHDEQQHTVAIKVVNSGNTDFVERFRHEVAALKALQHKHILPVLDHGEHGSWHYCVMPYIKNGTLRERIARGPLTQVEAGKILAQLASALQFAHDHGILHRDIKPSNILLKDEENGQHVYLADFGLAKGVEEASDLTLIGTPEYMAPELADGPALTRSDIYALGIVLYQMLTGSVPFKASTPMAVYCKHIQERPLPPSLLNPAISMQVEQVVLRALEKNPQDRFKTVQEMADAYAQALTASARQTKMLLQESAFLTPSELRLAAPTLRVIPVAQMEQSRHHFHPAIIALAAFFFLVMVPLALGFTLHPDGMSIQAPIARGARAEFVGQLQATPPPTPTSTSTKTPVPPAVHYVNQPTGNSQGHGSGGGQGHGGGHKHKHKHGHKNKD
jgi:serine/threonine protein kinase